MTSSTENPKVFLSYSWTDTDHEQFVMGLATALRDHGVDAILDKWDLKPGQDKYVFMESMVVDPSVLKVLVICDRKYQEKADARAGGVGTESQIISQELYSQVAQTKFIPIVCEHSDDGTPCLPVFMKSRIYVDISTDERYGEGLEELLRLIYDQPFHQKPKLGKPPAFLTTNAGVPHVKELVAALKAIQGQKPNKQGLELLFVKGVLTEIEKLYVQPFGDDYDEGVYQAIAGTKGLRDQVSDYVDAVASFSNDDPAALGPLLKLMEQLAACFGRPKQLSQYIPGWADLFTFFALETFLIAVAALLRYERWKSLRKLLSNAYLVPDSSGDQKVSSYLAFDSTFESLELRNVRLKLNRTSLAADLLKERSSPEKTPFSELMQADLFLTLDTAAKLGASQDDGWQPWWSPRTAAYLTSRMSFPLFLKAANEDVRAGMHIALGAKSGPELASHVNAASQRLNGFRYLSNVNQPFLSWEFVTVVNLAALSK